MNHLKNAAFVLGVFAVCYVVQKKVMVIPVIGAYLPGGPATA
jgi:hypothetical protein